ncbi:PilW family protein [Paracidovorax citrulli]
MRGSTLVEVLIGAALGAVVATAATVAMRVVLSGYRTAAAELQRDQQGQQALDAIAHLLRHAGWRPGGGGAWPHGRTPSPPLMGRDDCGKPSIDGVPQCGGPGVGASDALLIRFGGADSDPDLGLASMERDRYMTDCSGFPVPAGAGEDYATTNVLYIGSGSDGEPQLLCRYPGRADGAQGATSSSERGGGRGGGNAGWATAVLARGVETMQLRFGVDNDGDGTVDTFVRAGSIGEAGWRRVLAVRVALVLRATDGRHAGEPSPGSIALMAPLRAGEGEGKGESEDDADTVFHPATARTSLRRVFATTVRLRNAPFCGPRPC